MNVSKISISRSFYLLYVFSTCMFSCHPIFMVVAKFTVFYVRTLPLSSMILLMALMISWFLMFKTLKSILFLTFPLLLIPKPLPFLSRKYIYHLSFPMYLLYYFFLLFSISSSSPPLVWKLPRIQGLGQIPPPSESSYIIGYLFFLNFGNRIMRGVGKNPHKKQKTGFCSQIPRFIIWFHRSQHPVHFISLWDSVSSYMTYLMQWSQGKNKTMEGKSFKTMKHCIYIKQKFVNRRITQEQEPRSWVLTTQAVYVEVESMNSVARLPKFESWFCYLPAVWNWENLVSFSVPEFSHL